MRVDEMTFVADAHSGHHVRTKWQGRTACMQGLSPRAGCIIFARRCLQL